VEFNPVVTIFTSSAISWSIITLLGGSSHLWFHYSDNVRGHWENKQIFSLTEKTLDYNKGTWDDPPERVIIDHEIADEVKIVTTELNSTPFIGGFKDPRTLLCYESWEPHLPKNHIFVGIFRHPLKVAESLKKRNGLSYEQSVELWKIYNDNLSRFLGKFGGFLINFDWPKEKLIEQIKQIIKKLGLSENVDLEEWYSGGLINSDKSFNQEYPLPEGVNSLYSQLIDRSKENEKFQILSSELAENQLTRIIDQLRVELQNQGNNFKKLNDKNLEIIENYVNRKDPMSLLLSLYYRRKQLKEKFPEVLAGDYSKLFKWARNICLKPDSELGPYLKEYKKNVQRGI